MPKPQTYRTAPFTIFSDTCVLLDKNAYQLCELLGYHKTSHSGWAKKGLFPLVAANLCTALQESQRLKPLNEQVYFFKTANCEHAKMITTMFKALSIPFTSL